MAAAHLGLLLGSVVGLGRFGVAGIDQAADADSVVLLTQADSDQEPAMVGAMGHGHIPPVLLADPFPQGHGSSAGGAHVFRAGLGGHGGLLGVVAMEDLPLQAAWQLRAMEAVFMLFQGLVILGHTPNQVQPGAEDGGVVGVAQGVMGRAAGLDAGHLHGGFQRLLGRRPVGLGVEDHLRVVPPVDPAAVQAVEGHILLENADVVKAPGEEHHILAAPIAEPLHGLREGNAVLGQHGVLDPGEADDLFIELAVEFGLNQRLELVAHDLPVGDPDRADLNDLAPDLHRQHPLGRKGPGPGLVPLHIENNVLHGC